MSVTRPNHFADFNLRGFGALSISATSGEAGATVQRDLRCSAAKRRASRSDEYRQSKIPESVHQGNFKVRQDSESVEYNKVHYCSMK